MKILIINTNENSGGAAKAANRLHKGLRNSGVESYMFVQKKQTNDKYVIGAMPNLFSKGINFLRSILDGLPKKMYRNREKVPWSVGWLPNPLLFYYIKKIKPDVINLHWINGGFVSIKQIGKLSKLNIPIVWTLHDMWPFAGGFHYSQRHLNYEESFLSKKVWETKKKHWKNLDLTILTPSKWLAEQAKKSELFKDRDIKVIPNGLDINVFKPTDKEWAKKELGLSIEKKYILFGAINAVSDKRKGFEYLQEALKIFKEKYKSDNIEVLIFGATQSKDGQGLEPNTNYLSNINNDVTLAMVYSAADVMIIPSIQDNLPNVVIESLACGIPCIAFNIGGMSDMIDHKKNGYLAEPFNTNDLASGIHWCLEDSERNKELSINTREKAIKEYSLEVQSRRYKKVFEDLL